MELLLSEEDKVEEVESRLKIGGEGRDLNKEVLEVEVEGKKK